ncbi:hypothetical protein [Chitinivorax sp. B]|uniref:hypothetical protein n=1 Tax=Chitinivorax sp. B TaxID=2502235 RepID=UPI0010F80264|nr:hypothetical protein [Chitinivorax sp. B]
MLSLKTRPRQSAGIVLAMAGILLGTAATEAQARSGVGLNLTGLAYYSPAIPTIDQFKMTDKWLTQCGDKNYPAELQCADKTYRWDTIEQSKLVLDENGWVKSLPASNAPETYRFVSALLFKDNKRANPSGDYTILYEGNGTLTYGLSASNVRQAPGRDVITVDNTKSAGLLISITKTDPNNYIRNIRVIPPGGVCANKPDVYAASAAKCTDTTGRFVPFTENVGQQIWHPAFLADLRSFRSLRFMDWGATNGYQDPVTWQFKPQPLVKWAERPLESNAFWGTNKGAPYTAMLNLANSVGADPWINLPPQIDDDFAIQFGRLAKSMMAPGRTLILEYGNEPWNGKFPATSWYVTQGKAKVASRAWDEGHPDWELGMNWHALRAAQVCQLVKAQFGTNTDKVKCVMNGQAAWTDLAKQYLDCSIAAKYDLNGQTCGKFMDALAIAPYFGDYLSDTKPAVKAARQSWYKEPDGGLGKVFEELMGENAQGNAVTPPLLGLIEDSAMGGAIERSRLRTKDSYALAVSKGLGLYAYEGGQHLVEIPSELKCIEWDNDGKCTKYEDINAKENNEKWVPLMIAANHDDRMGKAYTKFMEKWIGERAQVYMYFNHVGTPSRYGAWGLKERQFTNDWVKWKAVQPYRKGSCWWTGCTP